MDGGDGVSLAGSDELTPSQGVLCSRYRSVSTVLRWGRPTCAANQPSRWHDNPVSSDFELVRAEEAVDPRSSQRCCLGSLEGSEAEADASGSLIRSPDVSVGESPW